METIQIFEGYNRGPHIRAVNEYCVIREFKPGSPIVIKGDESTHICIILGGQATALISQTLKIPFLPGQSFGELSFIDDRPRSVRVNADGETVTTIAVLTREAMTRIQVEDPELAAVINANLLKTMARIVRATDTALQGLDIALQRQLVKAAPSLLGRLTAAVLS